MLDVENYVIDRVGKGLKAAYPGILVPSTSTSTPSSFPCVAIEETENTTYGTTADAESNEHHTAMTFEVNVYTSKASGAKQEAKKIANTVDELFGDKKLGLGFRRVSKTQVPNADPTVYRLVMRYYGVVGEDGIVYQ